MAYTNFSNVTSFQDLLTLANTNTSSWFWTAMMFAFYVIATITMINFKLEVAMLVAGFLTIILGLLLANLGLVAWVWVGVIVGLELLAFIYSVWSSGRD